jgi:hypothetical protein
MWAMAQELLLHSVASCTPRGDQIVAAAHEVSEALLLWRRWLDERECPGAVEREQLLGVAMVGLDAVTRPDRHERGRHHIACNAHRAQQAQRVIATRASLVADDQAHRPAEPLDQRAQCALCVGDLLKLQLAGTRVVGR